jgi:uncharacterized metal-binding protein
VPNFKTHYYFNLFVGLSAGIYAIYYDYLPFLDYSLFFLAFIIGTDYITPDVDVRSTPYYKFPFIWYPYRKASSHRGLSHTIIGIFIRILWILAIILLASYLLNQLDSVIDFLMNTTIYHYMLFLGGIIIANLLHLILDDLF